jgi:hypothetical protein
VNVAGFLTAEIAMLHLHIINIKISLFVIIADIPGKFLLPVETAIMIILKQLASEQKKLKKS